MSKKPVIRITKKFSFEAAHALSGYNGLCKNIHGHSYVLYVTIKGNIMEDNANPKLGMLMDFSCLKKIVTEKIIDVFDHGLLLNESTELAKSFLSESNDSKIISLPFQPTCENLIVYFSEILSRGFPEHIELHSLKLHETETAYSEWFAEDNQ